MRILKLLTALTACLAMLAACDNSSDTTQTTESPAQGLAPAPVLAGNMVATARRGVPLDQEAVPAPIPVVIDTDLRQTRNYPMQPPLIPHDIRGYEVNLQANTCMACHARGEVKDTQAPMISVTHYMDRSGNFLAEISPRRYFCTQCHVIQTASNQLVENSFVDMGVLIRERAENMPAQEN
ncbi:MAG: nitrate reductase cytochrome c-type subunit [Gammaproteobacteria bacterium]